MALQSRSPQRPDDLVVEVEEADAGAVAAAVERARAAGGRWAAASALERSAALVAAADALAGAADEVTDLVVREVGKPVTEAAAETGRGVGILRYYAQQALDPDGETYPGPSPAALLLSRRRPRGVAGLVTPWNFPVAIPLWKAAPALAFGNAVALKPSPEATAVALRLAELLAPALPEDLFQVVPGGADTGEAMLEAVDCISFTGSVAVGHRVAVAADRARHPQPGRDGRPQRLDRARRRRPRAGGRGGRRGGHGLRRPEVHRHQPGHRGRRPPPVHRGAGRGRGGPGRGRPGRGGHRGRAGHHRAGPPPGGGGGGGGRGRRRAPAADRRRRPATGPAGSWPRPWSTASPPDARLAQEEVFGPIAVVLAVADEDEAVRVANGVRYGLVGSVFTRDLDRALGLAARLDTGMIRVNAPTSGVDYLAPFGGEKDSSFGPREQGKAARDFYTSTRTITILPAGG